MQSSEWIEWKWSPEKTYPETLETEVWVKYRDGMVSHIPDKVAFWHEHSPEHSNWFNTNADADVYGQDIVAYRLAK